MCVARMQSHHSQGGTVRWGLEGGDKVKGAVGGPSALDAGVIVAELLHNK